MISLLIKLLTLCVSLVEEHPDIAKGLLSRALELLHRSQAPATSPTGVNILRSQQAAQAGLQAGLSAAMAAAATSAAERQKHLDADLEAARVAAERQHDIDHGIGADTPIPFTLPEHG